MGDLRSRFEVTKLAAELGVDEQPLQFLAASTPAELRDLRAAIASARFARNEHRVRLLASLSRSIPVQVIATIAQHALGPMLSARVVGALDPQEAGRLAMQVDAAFLAELAVSLDPQRVAPILRALPETLVIDVAQRLRDAGEYLALARFVALVEPDVAMVVAAGANGEQLLQVALYTDEPAALDALARELPDATLAEVIRAVAATHSYDAAVVLLSSLSPEVCTRLVAQTAAVDSAAREALVQAVADDDVWDAVLPALGRIDGDLAAALVNVPATLDPAVIDRVVAHARRLDLAPLLAQLLLMLDDDHRAALEGSGALRDAGALEWLVADGGEAGGMALPLLEKLRLG